VCRALRGRLVVLAISFLMGVSAAPAWAYDTSGAARAIAVLNQQRAANGIPPVRLDQSLLESSCTEANHNIASAFSGWSADSSPWDNAPFHQAILYDPAQPVASYAVYAPNESSFPGVPPGTHWTCMWFNWNDAWSAVDSGSPRFYAFTGDDGRANVPYSEKAAESPYTPAEVLGLSQPSGPNLLVFALGIGLNLHIMSATLTSASGRSVAVATVDGTSTYDGEPVGFPWHGVIIPKAPLAPRSAYTASVHWEGSDGTIYPQTFSFTTAAKRTKTTNHRKRKRKHH
jgi:hypothetical protein